MSTEKILKGGRMWIPELFEKIGTLPDKQDRITALKEYCEKGEDHSYVLRCVAECLWRDDIVFALPEGAPPYKVNEAPDYPFAGGSLFKAVKTLYRYIENPNMIQDKFKRERLFLQTLESLHDKEAKLLISMKDKKLKGYGKSVNKMLFKEVFPEWFPDKISPEDESKKELQTPF